MSYYNDKVWDRGPLLRGNHTPEELRRWKLDRAEWVRVNGDVPAVQISVFSAAEACERDPWRFSIKVPAEAAERDAVPAA